MLVVPVRQFLNDFAQRWPRFGRDDRRHGAANVPIQHRVLVLVVEVVVIGVR